jgi:hypothetical protein
MSNFAASTISPQWRPAIDAVDEIISRWVNDMAAAARAHDPWNPLPTGWDKGLVSAEKPIVAMLSNAIANCNEPLIAINAVAILSKITEYEDDVTKPACDILLAASTDTTEIKPLLATVFAVEKVDYVKRCLWKLRFLFGWLEERHADWCTLSDAESKLKQNFAEAARLNLWPSSDEFVVENLRQQLLLKRKFGHGFGEFFERPQVQQYESFVDRIGIKNGSRWSSRYESSPVTVLDAWLVENAGQSLDDIATEPLEYLLLLMEAIVVHEKKSSDARSYASTQSTKSGGADTSNIGSIAGQVPRLTSSRKPLADPNVDQDGPVGIDSYRMDGILIEGLSSRQKLLLEVLHRANGKAVDIRNLIGTNKVWDDEVSVEGDAVGSMRTRVNAALKKSGVQERVETADNSRTLQLKLPKSATPKQVKKVTARKRNGVRPKRDGKKTGLRRKRDA